MFAPLYMMDFMDNLPRGRMIKMAKGTNDLILRDRLQFTLDANGAQTTVYGRFDLSEYVSTLARKGLSIKEVNFMLRDDGAGNTGNFPLSQGLLNNTSATAILRSQIKMFATTRAYEFAADVGIASPDVLHIETFGAYLGPQPPGAGANTSSFMYAEHYVYPVQNLHPDGFPVVTDLLVGVAFDNWDLAQNKTLELDVMLIAEPITITQKQLTEMLVQGQDQ
tara:strand:- start:693 stop:1358 length:666 start_codon:yes stop_codon:yes gene_type:complete